MLTVTSAERPSVPCLSGAALRTQAPPARADFAQAEAAGRRIGETFRLLADSVAPQRRVVHAGDVIYQAGERFEHLYVLQLGLLQDRQPGAPTGASRW